MLSSSTLMRFLTLVILSFSALLFIGPIIDFTRAEPARLMGWINNAALVLSAIFTPFLLLALPRLHQHKERLFLIAILLIITFSAWHTMQVSEDELIISLGALLIDLSAVAGGILAYIAARDGVGIQTRFVIALGAGCLALPIAPILIAAAPDLHASFKLSTYGFSNIRVFGYFSSTIVALLTGVMIHRSTTRQLRYVLFPGITLCWMLLFWSGSRAGLAALGAGLAITLLVMRKPSIHGLAMASSGTLLGIALSPLVYQPGPSFGILRRLMEDGRKVADSNAVSDAIRTVSTHRIDMWHWALGKIMDAPLIGHGSMPMTWMRTPEFNFYHTHNIVIEYLLDFGFPMGLALLGAGLYAWIRSGVALRLIDTPVAAALFAFICVSVVYGNFSAILFFSYHLCLLLIAMGTMIGWMAHTRSSREAADTPPEPDSIKPKAAWLFDET